MRQPVTFLTVTAAVSLLLATAAHAGEKSLWQQFNNRVTETSKEIGKGLKQGGKAAVQGARQGSQAANDTVSGKGSNKQGSSDK